MSICRAHTPGETNTCRPGWSVGDVCCPLCGKTRVEIVDHDKEKVHFRVHPIRVILVNAAANCPPSLCFCVPCTFSVDDWEIRSDNTANVQRRYCFHTTTSTFSNIDHFDLRKLAFIRTDGSVVNIQRLNAQLEFKEERRLKEALHEFYENNPDAFNKKAFKSQNSKQSLCAHSRTPQPPREVPVMKRQEKRLSSTPLPPALRTLYPGLSDAAIWEKLMSGQAPTTNSSTSAVRIQVTRTRPKTIDVSNPINTIYENNTGIRTNQAGHDANAAPTYQFAESGAPQTSSFSPSNHLESTYDSTTDKSNYFEVESTYDATTNYPSSRYSETAYNLGDRYDTSTFEQSTTSAPAYSSPADNIGHVWL